MVITRPSVPLMPVRSARHDALARAQRRFGWIDGAVIAVSTSPASGGKPVVTLRNAHGSTTGYHVHTHFHGDQLYDQQVDYEGHIGQSVAAAWERDPSQVFVLPEARNESAAPRSDWNNIRSVGELTRAGLVSLGLEPTQAERTTVSGHSAGGSPVAKAIARGDLGSVDRIELYDAAVSSQHNPVSDAERRSVRKFCAAHPERFVVMPGVMQSSWLDYIDRSRWTARASDHWTPLWSSLGRDRDPSG